MDIPSPRTSTAAWKSSAQPNKVQDLSNSLQLLRHIQSHPQTLFAKKPNSFYYQLHYVTHAYRKEGERVKV